MTTVLAFILTIAVLVAVHEWGHYRMALACGVRVLRFSIGFGRVLWRRQATPQSTEFVVCALPLGGYVKMLDTREGPVPEGEATQAFDRRPLFQRSLIVAAGPLANLVLAVVLYAASYWIGVEEPLARIAAPVAGSPADQAGLRAGDTITALCRNGQDCQDIASLSALSWQLSQAVLDAQPVTLEVVGMGERAAHRVTLALERVGSEGPELPLRRLGFSGAYSPAVISRVNADGPAARAGLQAGDRVLRVDGAVVDDASSLRERIRRWGSLTQAPQPMQWTVDRQGQMLELEVTPRTLTQDGILIGRVDAMIGAAPEMVLVRMGVLEGLREGGSKSYEVSALTVRMLGKMLIGEASLRNLSGPLTIADYAGQSAERGISYYLGFLALVSISLFVLNLIPLPMLDGGHLMYHLFEWVTGRSPSEVWIARLQRIGMALLLMLMALALTNDISRFLGLH